MIKTLTILLCLWSISHIAYAQSNLFEIDSGFGMQGKVTFGNAVYSKFTGKVAYDGTVVMAHYTGGDSLPHSYMQLAFIDSTGQKYPWCQNDSIGHLDLPDAGPNMTLYPVNNDLCYIYTQETIAPNIYYHKIYKISRQACGLDSSFGFNGVLDYGLPSLKSVPYAASNGDLYYATVHMEQVNVYKFLADGQIDLNFGNGGFATVFVDSVQNILHPFITDDHILVFASANDTNSKKRACVIRLLPDGTPDSTFGNNGNIKYTIGKGNFNPSLLVPVAVNQSGDDLHVIYRRNTSDYGLTLWLKFNTQGYRDTTFLLPDSAEYLSSYLNSLLFPANILVTDEGLGVYEASDIFFNLSSSSVLIDDSNCFRTGWTANNHSYSEAGNRIYMFYDTLGTYIASRLQYTVLAAVSTEEEKISPITVYPNPVGETLKLQLPPSAYLYDLEIRDSYGRLLYREEGLPSGNAGLSFPFSSGIYVLTVQNGKDFYHHKIIKP